MSKSFAQPSLKRRSPESDLPIHLIFTEDKTGEECYFLLRARFADYRRLMAEKTSRVNIADYGELLSSGYGKPNAQARAGILEQFGVKIPDDL